LHLRGYEHRTVSTAIQDRSMRWGEPRSTTSGEWQALEPWATRVSRRRRRALRDPWPEAVPERSRPGSRGRAWAGCEAGVGVVRWMAGHIARVRRGRNSDRAGSRRFAVIPGALTAPIRGPERLRGDSHRTAIGGAM